jgi:hypothetical protein
MDRGKINMMKNAPYESEYRERLIEHADQLSPDDQDAIESASKRIDDFLSRNVGAKSEFVGQSNRVDAHTYNENFVRGSDKTLGESASGYTQPLEEVNALLAQDSYATGLAEKIAKPRPVFLTPSTLNVWLSLTRSKRKLLLFKIWQAIKTLDLNPGYGKRGSVYLFRFEVFFEKISSNKFIISQILRDDRDRQRNGRGIQINSERINKKTG